MEAERYMVFNVRNGESATMKSLVGSSDDYYEASLIMQKEGNLMYDQVTTTFFDPGWVYSEAIAKAAMDAIRQQIGRTSK